MSASVRRSVARALCSLPGGETLVTSASQEWARRRFRRSDAYWERHYLLGGNSGGGSYGRLAEFKAEVLNQFVQGEDVRSVVEWGCGDGHQLSLARYPKYLGLDVSATAVDMCVRRFRSDDQKSFIRVDPDRFLLREGALRADLALSLDVLYHLIEPDVFAMHLDWVFGSAERFVLIYAVDEDRPQLTPHVKFRRFTPWIEQRRPGWRLTRVIPNRYPHQGDDGTGSDAAFHLFERASSS